MCKPLTDLTREELGRLFPVKICNYDPTWPKQYTAEKKNILLALHAVSILNIYHIGSTAIPGMPAKPTIDILIEIHDKTDLATFQSALESIGYIYEPQPAKPAPHMMFMKGYSAGGYIGQTFHVHIRYLGDLDELYFRDYLIAHQATAEEYAALKHSLQAKFTFDRDGYTDAKKDFISNITLRAKQEFTNGGCIMDDFPDFMKSPQNRVPSSQQNTQDIEGYYYQGADGGQMAFWTCNTARESKKHMHDFDEYTIIVSGQYTACFEDREVVLNPGDELFVPAGTLQWGRCTAGTRSIHAFGGMRIKNK